MELFDWDVAAGGNGFSLPDGFPEGMQYSAVNNAAREIMAVLARWYTDTSGELQTAGTGNAYTLTSARTIGAYADGQMFRFRAHAANTGSATINISGVGAATLYRPDGTTLDGSELKLDGAYEIVYSSGLGGFVLSATGVAATVTNRGEVELATDAEALAVTAADRAITPENLAAFNLWTDDRSYESAEQTAITTGVATFAHGLSAVPLNMQLLLRCKTAELGYSVGDELIAPIGVEDSDGAALAIRGANLAANSTNFYIMSSLQRIPHRTTGALTSFTPASWKFVVRAFA